jgi:hypothetical protein
MSQLVRKTAVAMAATAAISDLTGMGSIPAYADNSSMQAKFCNVGQDIATSLIVTGINQNSQQTT